MMKRLALTVVTAAALCLGLEETAAAAPRPGTPALSTDGAHTQAVWHQYGGYRFLSDCDYAGRWLLATGQVQAWFCEGEFDNWRLMVLD